MDLGFLDRKDVVLIVVDVQEKFRPVVFEFDRVVRSVRKLVEGFRILNLPVVVTEQYPQGLGRTVPELQESLGVFKPVEKTSFSCFGDSGFDRELERLGKKTVVLAGIEAHVCILKTALDALMRGLAVHVPVDCVSSIHESDCRIAVERYRQAGVFLASSEMLLFQLIDDSKVPEFRKISELVRKYA